MKTNIRKLDSLTHNDTAATKLINDNFSALQQGIEDALSRSGKTPNFMDAELDMNKNRIINLGEPVDDSDLATKKYVDDTVATEETRATGVENTLSGRIDGINNTLSSFGNIVTHNVSEFATATQGAKADTALQPADLGNATLTIKKNNTSVGTFTANSKTDTDINLVIPTTAADVDALPDNTKYAASISLSLDSATYILTVQLKDQDGNNLGTAATINLPLGSVVVNGSYDSVTKSIILVLANGNTITIPVGDLVSGLQTEITSSNMLDADLVDDSTSTNKFVTASDKTAWDGKQDALVSGTNIKTLNGNSLLGSGDLEISGGSDIICYKGRAEFNENVANGTIDVSSVVETGVNYLPIVTVAESNMKLLNSFASYNKTNKYIAVSRDLTVNSGATSVVVYCILIPSPSTNFAGFTSGRYLESNYDRYYSKAESDNTFQTLSNLVTSVDSTSTDAEYPSAKLFYDTCGDIETLINAL